MISTPRPLRYACGTAGAEEESFAGLELYAVEQHRGDDARVAGVVVGERRVWRVLAAEACRRFGRGMNSVGHLVGVGGQHGGEDFAQRGFLGVCVQEVHVRLE